MIRTSKTLIALLGFCLFAPVTRNAFCEERVVYEYGFENDWNDWQGANPWELSRDGAHGGEFSAHCPVQANLNSSLYTPAMEIPDDGEQTFFEFWVHCDARVPDSDNDNFLDDYFYLSISVDGGGPQDVLYDYCRDDEWQDNWIHYLPGTWFRDDMPAWRVRHDLTQFAGHSVRLEWMLITDDDMGGNQGTGLWIDDFKLIATDARQNDVGVEWVHVKYPTSMGLTLASSMKATNFGTFDQARVVKYYQLDAGDRAPIIPWNGLIADSSQFCSFNITPNRIPNQGMIHLRSYCQIQEDEDHSNDTATADLMIYPENVWQLGYDDRRWSEVILFDQGGPAVLFTPVEDNIRGEFSIYALEAVWSDEQDQNINAVLTISTDDHGQPGQQIFTREFTVTPQQLSPRRHYIDLADIEVLKNLQTNFWVSIVPDRNSGFPQIMGRVPEGEDEYWGAGHYFNFDGNRMNEINSDFQLHAILTNGEIDEINLATQPVLNFGAVALNRPKSMPLTIVGGSTAPVTIEDVEINSEFFSIEGLGELPLELSVGEIAEFTIICNSEQEGVVEANLSFTCNDDSPPVVHLICTTDEAPEISVDPDEIDFGSVEREQFDDTELIIFNIGTADLVISDISVEGEGFDIDFAQEFTIAPEGDATVFPIFNPMVAGRFDGRLVIACNDPYTPLLIVPLTGFCPGVGSPVVENPISDCRVEEDFNSFVVADLDTVFRDMEGDELLFEAVSDEASLQVNIDDENRLTLSSSANWNGHAVVTVSANDQVEEARRPGPRSPGSADRCYTIAGYRNVLRPNAYPNIPSRDNITEDSFEIEVIPVNDAPDPFYLFTPEEGFQVLRDQWDVRFAWDAAQDVDGDRLIYNLHFEYGFGGDSGWVEVHPGRNTEMNVELSVLFGGIPAQDRDTSLVAEWWVTAHDQSESSASEERRHISIELPLSIGTEPKLSLIPSVLTLSAFPNPFNSRTTISYSLPRSGRYAIDVIDLQGRLVTRLSDGWKEAGSYREVWDGAGTPGGSYIIKLNSDKESFSRPITLVK